MVKSYVCGTYYDNERSQPTSAAGHHQIPADVAELLADAVVVNSAYNSVLVAPTRPGELVKQLGNKTECGLIEWVARFGADYQTIRQRHPGQSVRQSVTFWMGKFFGRNFRVK